MSKGLLCIIDKFDSSHSTKRNNSYRLGMVKFILVIAMEAGSNLAVLVE